MLLLASLVFYSYGEPVYVVLMGASALCNYLFALWIERFQDQKKWIVSVAVILNLALDVYKRQMQGRSALKTAEAGRKHLRQR